MLVLKFGGSSLGSVSRMQKIVPLLTHSKGKQVVVLSAIEGTTNSLVNIGECLFENQRKKAKKLIDELEQRYIEFINQLYKKKETKQKALHFIEGRFDYLCSFTRDVFTVFEEKRILAQGELLSTTLFHLYLNEIGVENTLISALDFMRIHEDEQPNLPYIEEKLLNLIDQSAASTLYITQGYICRNAYGEIDNLKRGGSDYTASIIGSICKASEVQIWTDIDGVHNNDPRIVENTSSIADLSFDEAAELAYFGAKILHPSSILPAKKANIPVRLKNTMNPTSRGTLISGETVEKGIKAIAAKDGIAAIQIHSDRMLLAYGFLRKVFEIFEVYKTPIDTITTSEVAVSCTIDKLNHLDEIVADIQKYGTVKVDKDLSIICIVGDFIAESSGYATRIFNALKDISIRMISYGGSSHNITILVNTENKDKALRLLHKTLFNAV